MTKSFKFTKEQAKNWKVMLDALRYARKESLVYDVVNYGHCPCGHYLKRLGEYEDNYDIDEVLQERFGIDYNSEGSDLEKFFTSRGPGTISAAIQQGELLLKQYGGVPQTPKGTVTITDRPEDNSILFTELEIGQAFRWENEIWIKTGEWATCLNDGLCADEWEGYYVELVNIEVIVS